MKNLIAIYALMFLLFCTSVQAFVKVQIVFLTGYSEQGIGLHRPSTKDCGPISDAYHQVHTVRFIGTNASNPGDCSCTLCLEYGQISASNFEISIQYSNGSKGNSHKWNLSKRCFELEYVQENAEENEATVIVDGVRKFKAIGGEYVDVSTVNDDGNEVYINQTIHCKNEPSRLTRSPVSTIPNKGIITTTQGLYIPKTTTTMPYLTKTSIIFYIIIALLVLAFFLMILIIWKVRKRKMQRPTSVSHELTNTNDDERGPINTNTMIGSLNDIAPEEDTIERGIRVDQNQGASTYVPLDGAPNNNIEPNGRINSHGNMGAYSYATDKPINHTLSRTNQNTTISGYEIMSTKFRTNATSDGYQIPFPYPYSYAKKDLHALASSKINRRYVNDESISLFPCASNVSNNVENPNNCALLSWHQNTRQRHNPGQPHMGNAITPPVTPEECSNERCLEYTDAKSGPNERGKEYADATSCPKYQIII